MNSTSKDLIAALRLHGLHPSPYSGRGMMGKYCVSVKNLTTVWPVAQAVISERLTDVQEPDFDQLGKSKVFYWPAFSWPGEEG